MTNRVTAKVIKGRYKGQRIDIELGPTSVETRVKVDGKLIKGVEAIYIKAKVGEITKTTLELIPEKLS